jgi:hypothetical protein
LPYTICKPAELKQTTKKPEETIASPNHKSALIILPENAAWQGITLIFVFLWNLIIKKPRHLR